MVSKKCAVFIGPPCMYVCMYVRLSQTLLLFFLDGIEPFLDHQFSMTNYKTLFFNF